MVPTGVENVFNYELDLAYSVDADGVATQLPEGTKENIPATLTQVDGAVADRRDPGRHGHPGGDLQGHLRRLSDLLL